MRNRQRVALPVSQHTVGAEVKALEPIDEGVPDEGRALAQALRTLFESLNISMRRYAARCHTDFGTVSRYLSGKRVPPWSFVKELLSNVAEHRGQHASDETMATLRQLHARALGTGKGTRRVVELQYLLEEADQRAREASSLERILREALQEQEHLVSQLQVELQSLRVAETTDRQRESSEVALLLNGYSDLRTERDRLRMEVSALKKQLAETTTARMLAEERCEQLERQIEEAESQEELLSQSAAGAHAGSPSETGLDEEESSLIHSSAAAEERLKELEDRLRVLKEQKEKDNSTQQAAPPKTPHAANQEDSLSDQIGYSPYQVLRRVDSAARLRPGDIEGILRKALDIQTADEVRQTENLLNRMPSYILYMFRDLRARAPRADINPAIGVAN